TMLRHSPIGGSNNTLTNNTCSNNNHGISLGRDSDHNILTNNTCSNNGDDGISLRDSDSNIFANNTCNSNRYNGISVRGSNNTLANNTCNSNRNSGIYLESSDSIFTNNTCNSNKDSGIYLESSDNNTFTNNTCNSNRLNGIILDYSFNNTLSNNTSLNNNQTGISLMDSNHNIIQNNTIHSNNIGIYLSGWDEYSRNNTAHYNNIFNNTEYGINATDNNGYTINATFNYWGDPSGPYHPTKNPSGRGDNVTDYVEFAPWVPKAEIISISPNYSLEGQAITFTGNGFVLGKVMSYVWRSSIDGELYNNTNASFTFTGLSNGTHTIYLRVQGNKGIWSEEVNTTLTINGIPRAKILQISPNPAVECQEVLFEGNGSDDGTIERYVWRSSRDNEIHNSTESDFSTDELSLGEHTIYFKVQDNYGVWSNEVSETLTIHTKPSASITSISPNPALNTDQIYFIGIGTDDGNIVRYAWSSSIDGEFYNSSLPEFNYSNLSNGTHIICFKVVDEFGVLSEEASSTLIINGKPAAKITDILPNPAIEGETVTFTG
ncbi:MAG: right-handed parallel beta-helix repeat-containing protein, partial [Thermoplasmata archaeon]|nr:right-handed parallel beta-helix repeat-containing protein [Thermoplasmata archaeon]